MTRPWFAALGFAGVALLLGAGTASPDGERSLLLLYSSDELGELAPCDCEGGANGGLARRAGEFAELEMESEAVFKCSSGDIFEFAQGKVNAKVQELKVRSFAAAMGRLQYDALGLGDLDLALGPETLKRFAEAHDLPLVCANAHGPDGRRLFPPYLVVEKGGVRVAFVAVVSPQSDVLGDRDAVLRRNLVTLTDPILEVRALLPRMRAESDLVVLLAHAGVHGSPRLADSLAVDVVFAGHLPAIEPEPRRIGHAIYGSVGAKSDHFGKLTVTLGDDGSVADFSGESMELSKDGPEDGDIAAMAAEVAALETPAVPSGTYVGVESCRTCHAEIYDAWSKTAHARAFASLADTEDWENPKCVGCHMTGAVDKNWQNPVAMDPGRLNVQCEECHGPGEAHVASPGKIEVDPRRCRVCHDAKNSPGFDYAKAALHGIH